jgi:hypothetical protein
MALVPLATKSNYFHVYDFRVKPGCGDVREDFGSYLYWGDAELQA